MQSRWVNLKNDSIILRQQGMSIREIEKQLSIPRSTLSGWLKEVPISGRQQKALIQRHQNALIDARIKAAEWHKSQKAARLSKASDEARVSLERIDIQDKSITELALAMLYWGEGSKNEKGVRLGNSNVELLRFFVSALQLVYGAKPEDLRCELHLRADQNSKNMIHFWSKNLGIPQNKFKGVYFDKRTLGKKTYDTYKGVCVVSYDSVAIQRKLMYLYGLYCQKIIQMRA